ncbi:MAG: flagellar hook-basal body complex protein FliE [Candidatus Gastranaerophilales bacterium]|nr:flagellar hook-basal body complex protein FliE [Candidatus Gastranaerophilales bacterium]
MSDMLIGKTNLNNFNIGMKDFMQEYRDNINDIQNANQDLKLGEIPNFDSKSISISEDQELVNDLKVLMNNNRTGLTASDQTTQGLSSDKTAKSFGNVLSNYINEVNNEQKASEKATKLFATGGNIDVHSVMIASEKASLSMQLTMQLRNKILQAYQEIHRMQV